MIERTFSSQGVRIFHAPYGVQYDDGEINGAGWYIQHMSVHAGVMHGVSDGIGPYSTFEEAVAEIKNEFGTWEESSDCPSTVTAPILTPDP